jgi:hypothetical protein
LVTISPVLTASVGASDWPNASPIIVVASIKAASEAATKTDCLEAVRRAVIRFSHGADLRAPG